MKKTNKNKRHQPFHCGLHCAVHNQRHRNGKKAKIKKKLTGLKVKKPIGRKKLMKKKKKNLN
jgi:hypothetical protein